MLSNGEEPIIKDYMMDGVATKLIQLYAKAIEDKELASEVHRVCSENYGFGAGKFLNYIIENRSAIRPNFETLRRSF